MMITTSTFFSQVRTTISNLGCRYASLRGLSQKQTGLCKFYAKKFGNLDFFAYLCCRKLAVNDKS